MANSLELACASLLFDLPLYHRRTPFPSSVYHFMIALQGVTNCLILNV